MKPTSSSSARRPALPRLPKRRAAGLLLSCLFAAASPAPAGAQALPGSCGSLVNGYGPLDYRTDKDRLNIVEIHHFTPEVESLIRGKESYIGADLDYTLRAFPNHHRALAAMMRYGKKLNVLQVPFANYTIECYFLRGLAFRPDDSTARMLFAIFLSENKRVPEALQHLDYVMQNAGDKALTYYNLGLVYLDIGQPQLALTAAHRAMALGFEGTALKDRLAAANQWAEPASAPR